MAKYLDGSGVTYLWQKIKAAFAASDHNHNGTYVGAASSTTSGHVATFGANGYTIQDSGFAIGQSVPAASEAGFISTADQTKLTGIETGAQVNVIEAITVNGSAVPVSSKTAAITISSGSSISVDSNDKVLSLSNDVLSSQLSLVHDSSAHKIQLLGKGVAGSEQLISEFSTDDFIKDGMLDYAAVHSYDGTDWTPALPSGATAPSGITAGNYIVLVWNTDAQKSSTFLDVTTVVSTYTAGNGLQLSNQNEFSVKTDNTTSPTSGSTRVTLTADSAGLRAEVDMSGKVDTVAGKGLSTEDYTTAEQTKLSGIATGAQVNTIETVKVNGSALTPDANKAVDITVPVVEALSTSDIDAAIAAANS